MDNSFERKIETSGLTETDDEFKDRVIAAYKANSEQRERANNKPQSREVIPKRRRTLNESRIRRWKPKRQQQQRLWALLDSPGWRTIPRPLAAVAVALFHKGLVHLMAGEQGELLVCRWDRVVAGG